jgi:carbonic anhydrase
LAAAALAAAPRSMHALPNAIAPSDALQRLMDGNGRYMRNQMNLKDFNAGRAARAQAQFPIAAILGCADSRVAAEFIFDQDPGDLFVCRVAGNYMNVDILASLEYGVEVLKAPLVMVLGHTNCGAVKAVLQYEKDRKPLPGHLQMMLDAVSPGVVEAMRQGPTDQLDHAIEANVRHNARRLRQAHPVITKAVEEKRVDVVSAVYELASGQVRLLK